jgi:hypothetical protein
MDNPIYDLNQFRTRVLPFSNVVGIAKGQRSTGKIETRKSIRALCFIASGAGTPLTRAQFLTDIGSIVVRAEGIVLREMTAQQILDLYKHYRDDQGAFTVEGVLPIEFADSAFDLAQVNNMYALGMLLNGKPVTLTYEINYLSPGTLTVDQILVRAIVDDRETELGLHKRIIPHTRSFASTGNQDITDLPKGDGRSSLLGYHFVLGSGVISQITVKDGSAEVLNQVPRPMIEMMLNNAKRKVQSGYFHVPFNTDNDIRSKYPLGPSNAHWLVQPTWSTSPAGSYTILEEREHLGL